MRCPYCRSENDRVIDSRTNNDGFSIRRRRQCLSCRRRFTTHERLEEVVAMKVVKKDGSRVPYEREKIRSGIEKACYKRPIPEAQIESILMEIESDMFTDFDEEVESQYLGEQVMEHLKRLDQVAYVRFASVYREFKDVHDFVDELEPILKGAQRMPK